MHFTDSRVYSGAKSHPEQTGEDYKLVYIDAQVMSVIEEEAKA
jgi:hypothetical protein